MFGRRRRARAPLGAPPDAIVLPTRVSETLVVMTRYNAARVDEDLIESAEAVPALDELGEDRLWIDVRGFSNLDLLRDLGERFGLHPVALVDCVHVPQIPKTEVYPNMVQVLLQTAHGYDAGLDLEQVSVFLGPSWVLTFQERSETDCLSQVRERLAMKGSRLRTFGADYLAYAVIDLVIDSYFPVLDATRARLLQKEEEASRSLEDDTLLRIRAFRKELEEVEPVLLNHRRAVERLKHIGQELISDSTRLFLRDTFDHASEQLDIIMRQAESARGLRDFHLALLSHRMNDVMRVLTLVATIFMPLSFLAGVYGMNFATETSALNMPELKWRYGYLAWWGASLIIVGAMALWFRRLGWIGRRSTTQANPERTS